MTTLYQKYLNCGQNITTDTRNITPNCIFFALKGESFNGNTFAFQALEAGAAFCVIDDPQFATDDRCIVVENTLEALQKLANQHRRQFDVPVIAITGSNGKTTTKELINAALSTKYKVACTAGNLNNHIGVPLTILSAPLDTEIFVIEMGANHQGEIRELCQIAAPTHGYITSIGKAHLEGFGGIEGVKKGKSELFEYLAAHKGTAFLNIEDKIIEELAKQRGVENTVYFGNNNQKPYKKPFCEGILLEADPYLIFRFGTDPEHYLVTVMTVQTQIFGAYNFGNAMAALTIGLFFEGQVRKVRDAIAAYTPNNNRAQIIEKNSNTYILDAYNANPTSMQAGLAQFATMKAEKRIVIIGAMRELGDYSHEEHGKIADFAKNTNAFEQIILVGSEFKPFASLATALFNTAAEVKDYLDTQIFENTHFYIKGSRGVRLEGVL